MEGFEIEDVVEVCGDGVQATNTTSGESHIL